MKNPLGHENRSFSHGGDQDYVNELLKAIGKEIGYHVPASKRVRRFEPGPDMTFIQALDFMALDTAENAQFDRCTTHQAAARILTAKAVVDGAMAAADHGPLRRELARAGSETRYGRTRAREILALSYPKYRAAITSGFTSLIRAGSHEPYRPFSKKMMRNIARELAR